LADPAYVDGLKMLARRELSAAQVRQRLSRKGHDAEAIEAAVERLRSERAIDDARVALAIVRTETLVKRRGRLRVRRQVEAAGIAPDIAERAIADVFGDLDPDALLNQALERRLRGHPLGQDPRMYARLFRHLLTQGFEADRVTAALRARRRRTNDD
jgi:regulatory protein